MSTLPHTDLSADLVTDSYQDSIYAAASRLRQVARVAGLRLALGTPDESTIGGRMPLGEISDSTARELATLLTSQPPASSQACAGESIADTAAYLRAVTAAAKIDLRIHVPVPGPGSVQLGEVDRDTVIRLADLIEASLADLYRCADTLGTALHDAGLHEVMVSADRGAIELGEITVNDGVVLLRLIESGVDLPDVDPDDQRAGVDLANRLTTMVKTVTGGGFLDAAYTPYCRRCGEESAILLGWLSPQHATALTAHLTQAAR